MFRKEQPPENIQQAQVTLFPDCVTVSGEVIYGADGPILKINPRQVGSRPELAAALEAGEQPATIWVRLTDAASGHLLQEGQQLSARLRVKLSDGRFMVKAAAFSLGVIAAVAIGTKAVQHHHPPH